MIYDKEQNVMEPVKSSKKRHSILDEVADSNDHDFIVDSESVEAESARRRRLKSGDIDDFSPGKNDILRSTQ